jgi:hypothetical protein
MKLIELVNQKTIYQNTALDLINGNTVFTKFIDNCVAFQEPIYSTVKSKEQLGIEDNNLIFTGDVLPTNPQEGQVAIHDGRIIQYRRINEN